MSFISPRDSKTGSLPQVKHSPRLRFSPTVSLEQRAPQVVRIRVGETLITWGLVPSLISGDRSSASA